MSKVHKAVLTLLRNNFVLKCLILKTFNPDNFESKNFKSDVSTSTIL